jgi:pimeloyl-ACP methyl ester carboxylesterase
MRIARRIFVAFCGLLLLVYLGLVGYAYWPRDAGIPARDLATPDDRFATLDELTIRYRLYGQPGEGRPELVLIHGFANNLHSFRYLAPLLADCCHVMAVDLPGFGLSSKPDDRSYYAYQVMADAVVQTAAAENFAAPIYVGHSLGGVIALRAGLADSATKALIFIEPGLYAGNLMPMRLTSIFPLPRLSALQFADRDFRHSMIRRSYADSSVLRVADLDNLMLAGQTDDYLTGMTAMLGYIPSGQAEVDMLPQVTIPVLTLWSAAGMASERAARLAQALPRSRTALVPDAGHYLHEEQPEITVAEIIKSIDEWDVTDTGSGH